MAYISNKDLESRLKKARAAREKAEEEYFKGATEVAGWQTPRPSIEEAPEDTRSNLSKVGGFLKGAGSQIAKPYKALSGGLAEVVADVTGESKKQDEGLSVEMENAQAGILAATEKLKDPALAPDQKTRWQKVLDLNNQRFKEATQAKNARTSEIIERTDPKKGAANVAKIGTDILSAGTYGAAARAGSAVNTGRAIARGAAGGAAINTAGSLATEFADDEDGVNVRTLATDAGLGAVLGGLGAGVSARGANKAASRAAEADRAVISGVDDSMDDVARGLDAEDAATEALTPPKTRLLDSGQGRMERRLQEIDDELDGLRQGETDPNAYSTNPEDIRSLEGEKVGRLNKSGTYGETRGATIADSSDTASRARELMRERKALQTEVEGLSSIERFDGASAPKIDVADPQFKDAVESELKAVENAFTDKQTGKVNALVDYFRTPTKVLRKIGLNDTADTVEKSFENYRKDFISNSKKLKDWERRAGPDASERIFKYLDGQGQKLTGEELRVANEMKAHLSEWADKLGLPEEARVSDYITHIFDKDFAGKTNDVTLASILDNKGSSKVYNPFTQKRLGNKGYKEDAFAAMEAYIKKSTRQLNMDPALKITADAAKNVDDRTARYLLKLNQGIAMKPDKFEQIVNDVVGSVTGDKFGTNAGTRAMRSWRNTVYRATLGMNVGSALRNLTQGTNTFAELGARRTLQGYSQLIRTFGEAAAQKASGKTITAWDELVDNGILGDAFHTQDRNFSALSSKLKKMDKGLWAMFDTAERINRGSAYFGAKAQALAKGMPEEKAIDYAKDIVGKTQFRFNDVETPLILRSQVAKTLGQFQSFNIKQAEFLGGTAKKALKGDVKEMAKIARWVGANIAVASSVGTLLGLKWHDAIPDFGTFRGVRSPVLDVGKNIKQIATGKNEYGQEEDRGELVKGAGKDLFGLTVPGGTQIKKTKEGLEAVDRGGSYTDSGKLRFTVEDSGENRYRGAMFGQYNLDEGQEFFGEGREAFTPKQTEIIDAVPSGERQAYESALRNLSDKTDNKLNTANKIRSSIKDKQFEKAKRLADEHNQSIDAEIIALEDRVGKLPKEMIDYLRSNYKVNYEYYKRKTD